MTSILNRLTTVPANGTILQGSYENASHEYNSFSISVASDQTGQLKIYQSNDAGQNDHHVDTIDVTTLPYFKYFARKANYIKVQWENDSGTDATSFLLQLKYHKDTLRDINDPIAHNEDTILVYGTDTNNNYPLLTDDGGRLQVDTDATIDVSNLGQVENVEAGTTVNTNTFTSSVSVENYKDAWILYEDTETGNGDTLTLWISDDDITYYPTEIVLQPVNHTSEAKRVATKYMMMSGIMYVKFKNESASAVNNVKLTVMGNNI